MPRRDPRLPPPNRARGRRSDGVALLEGGRLTFGNAAWDALERELGGGLRRAGRTGPARAGLGPLALAEAGALAESGRAARVCRCEHPASGRVLQLHLERPRRSRRFTLVQVRELTGPLEPEREATRAALEQRARLQSLSELASGVAHDFNNVFFAFKLRMEALSRELKGRPRARVQVLLQLLTEESQRIIRLQGLAFRPAEAPAEQSDLAAVVADAVALVQPGLDQSRKATGARVQVQVRLGELPPVRGSPVDLRHVFVNLLLNARDAMPKGGRVEVTGRRVRGQVRVQVADRGTGIPPADLARVFDPFFTTKPGRGTGVGLSMARGVLERLGGQIEAANRPGGGAVFRLSFPVAPSARPAPAARARAGLRVLVVDDEPDVREALVLALAEQKVEAVGTGEEALARVRAGRRYDVVLCDLGLPGLDGWAVTEALRRQAPALPIYLISGWANQIDRADPRLARVDGLLPKPLGLAELDAVLARVPPRPGARGSAR